MLVTRLLAIALAVMAASSPAFGQSIGKRSGVDNLGSGSVASGGVDSLATSGVDNLGNTPMSPCGNPQCPGVPPATLPSASPDLAPQIIVLPPPRTTTPTPPVPAATPTQPAREVGPPDGQPARDVTPAPSAPAATPRETR